MEGLDLRPEGMMSKSSECDKAFLADAISMVRKTRVENSTSAQFFKFGFVGVLNTLVGYLAFFLLLNYCSYLLSLVLAHFIGVTHSYIWNKYWTFKTKEITGSELIRFNLVYALVLASNAVVLIFFVEYLKLDPRMGQLIALPVVTLISFTGQKYWSFRKG